MAETFTTVKKVMKVRVHLKRRARGGYTGKKTFTQSSDLFVCPVCIWVSNVQRIKSEVALEDLIKKTSRSAKLSKTLRNTKTMLLLQSSDAIKKIRFRHKYTAAD